MAVTGYNETAVIMAHRIALGLLYSPLFPEMGKEDGPQHAEVEGACGSAQQRQVLHSKQS